MSDFLIKLFFYQDLVFEREENALQYPSPKGQEEREREKMKMIPCTQMHMS